MVLAVYSDIRVTLKLYQSILQNEEVMEFIVDISFKNPSVMFRSSFDILDQWNNLASDVFNDTLVSESIITSL